MTDRDMVVAAAEKVMGWRIVYLKAMSGKEIVNAVDGDGLEFRIWCPNNDILHEDWKPLRSDADAFLLVDAMSADGYYVTIHSGWHVELHCPYGPCEKHGNPRTDQGHLADAQDPDRRRAIVIAALRAVGVEA